MLRKLVLLLITNLVMWFFTSPTFAQSSLPSVEVQENYIELRPQPSKREPVFYVVEKGNLIKLVERSGSWLLIKSEYGVRGWANQSDLTDTIETYGLSDLLKPYDPSKRITVGAGGTLRDGRTEAGVNAFVEYRVLDSIAFDEDRISLGLRFTAISGNTNIRGLFGEVRYGVSFQDLFWQSTPKWLFAKLGYGQYSNADVFGDDASGALLYGVGSRFYLNQRFSTTLTFERQDVDFADGPNSFNAFAVDFGLDF